MVALGIDVGLSGAWALVSGGTVLAVCDIPTREKSKTARVKREIDALALYQQIAQIVGLYPRQIVVMTERLTGAGKGANWIQGTASLFSTADSNGVVRAVLAVLRLEPELVMPAVWKKEFGLLKKKKAESLLVARKIFGGYDGLMRLKDHNRAEALLIARYCWLRHSA